VPVLQPEPSGEARASSRSSSVPPPKPATTNPLPRGQNLGDGKSRRKTHASWCLLTRCR
jgi:hypothetical protein